MMVPVLPQSVNGFPIASLYPISFCADSLITYPEESEGYSSEKSRPANNFTSMVFAKSYPTAELVNIGDELGSFPGQLTPIVLLPMAVGLSPIRDTDLIPGAFNASCLNNSYFVARPLSIGISIKFSLL